MKKCLLNLLIRLPSNIWEGKFNGSLFGALKILRTFVVLCKSHSAPFLRLVLKKIFNTKVIHQKNKLITFQ